MNSSGQSWRFSPVGCPIRKSTDQRLLAASRGLSQLAASFIACWHQGIHRIALSSLITKVNLLENLPPCDGRLYCKKTQRIVIYLRPFLSLPMCSCQRTRAWAYLPPRSLALTKLSVQHVNFSCFRREARSGGPDW